MRKSLESSESSTRPILPKDNNNNNSNNSNSNSNSNSNNNNNNNRASTRFSSYSVTSSALDEKAPAAAMSNATDSRVSNEMQKYANSLDRMESKRLQDQRYTPSTEKDEDMSKLALGAKVQRALDRRYSSQDAEYKPKPKKTTEKSGLAQSSR